MVADSFIGRKLPAYQKAGIEVQTIYISFE
jgi:hypothetical protein